MRKEQILHQMWKKYEKTKSKIELLKEKWTNRKANFEEKLSDKYAAIEKYKKEIESLKELNEVQIQDNMYLNFLINSCKIILFLNLNYLQTKFQL